MTGNLSIPAGISGLHPYADETPERTVQPMEGYIESVQRALGGASNNGVTIVLLDSMGRILPLS
jgi:hypothetical protein